MTSYRLSALTQNVNKRYRRRSVAPSVARGGQTRPSLARPRDQPDEISKSTRYEAVN